MIITTYSQLHRVMLLKVLPDLMEHLSQKAEEILKEKLKFADISTSTLQEYVTHETTQKGDTYTSTIYIDDVGVQKTAGSESWGNFKKFISLDGSVDYGGKSIAWNMINWLENTGANGVLGNNPIKPIGMFDETIKEIKLNIKKWIKDFLAQYGLS